MSIWINPNRDTCKQPLTGIAKQNCYIVQLVNSFMLYFESPNIARVYFFAEQAYYSTTSKPIFVPYNQWINIQLVFNQYSGYQIMTFDVQGKLMQSLNQTYNIQNQNMPKSQLSLFMNYSGFIRSFFLMAKQLSLPQDPLMSASFNDKDFLFFFKFQAQYNKGRQLINYGSTAGYKDVGALVLTPVYEEVLFYDAKQMGVSYIGSIDSSIKLYDGIACNDGSMTVLTQNTTSYIKGYTPYFFAQNSTPSNSNGTSSNVSTPQISQNPILPAMTIEFWFRAASLSQINSLFSLFSKQSGHEFFSVFKNSDSEVVCAPFGQDSVATPFVTLTDLTEQLIGEGLMTHWIHIACSYEYQQTIQAFLYSAEIDQSYEVSLDAESMYIPQDQFEVYIGNDETMSSGSTNCSFKEVRVWGVARNYDDVSNNLRRQINPFILSNKTLLAYFRLAEGSYTLLNYASYANSITPLSTSLSGITFTSDPSLVICPQLTFYLNGLCYSNPIGQMINSVFPMFDQDMNLVHWNFTLRHSEILDEQFLADLNVQWNTDDMVLASIGGDNQIGMDLVLPVYVFADQSKYLVQAVVANEEMTFNSADAIMFVPVYCQGVIVQGSDAYSANQLYLDPQSVNDIDFTLSVITATEGCITFYDTLSPNITYKISPMPYETPLLTTELLDSQTLKVTIPREEQFKFIPQVDSKIIINIYWTNSQYGAYMNTSDYTFQNVLYTINFNYSSQTVVPVLKNTHPVVTYGQQVQLDASQSYISNIPDSLKYQNLQFEWTCPPELASLCINQHTSVLKIDYFQFSNASGQMNTSYTFTVKITWNSLQFFASNSVTWLAIQGLNFTLFPYSNTPFNFPATQAFEIKMYFPYYDTSKVSQFNLTRIFSPSVNSAKVNVSANKTYAFVQPNSFSHHTNYTLTVFASLYEYPALVYSSVMSFRATFPPYGGSISVSPQAGYINLTEFNLSISNWQSDVGGVQYQVYKLNTNLSLKQLSSDWIDAADNFTFTTSSTTQIQVVIKDSSGDYINVIGPSVNVSVAPSNASGLQIQAVKKQLKKLSKDLASKYEYLEEITNSYSLSSDIKQLVLDTISADVQKYAGSPSEELVNSNSATTIAFILSSDGLNDQLIQAATSIMASIKESQSFSSLISSNSNYLNSYASILSNLLVYNKNKGSRRRLQTYQYSYSQTASDLKDSLVSLAQTLCSSSDATLQEVQTDSFDIQVQSISRGQSKLVMSNMDADIVFSSADIISEAESIMNIDSSNLCAYALYIFGNPFSKSMLQSRSVQYSENIIAFDIVDAQLNSIQAYTDLKLYTQIQFSVSQDTFINNQTVCMKQDDMSLAWSSEECMTQSTQTESQISCYCSQSSGALYALVTDQTRSADQTPLWSIITDPETNSIPEAIPLVQASSSSVKANEQQQQPMEVKEAVVQEQSAKIGSSETNSLVFMSIVITLICLSVFTPITAYYLDKRDVKCFQQKIESNAKQQLIAKVAQISKEPLSYWIYKQDEILSYNLKSISLFSHLLTQLHPFFSIFTKFDILESRVLRFSIYNLQLSVFALICVLAFGPSYREGSARDDLTIDQTDINMILLLGVIGMIVLLPSPVSTKCLRSKLFNKDQKEMSQNSLQNSINRQNDAGLNTSQVDITKSQSAQQDLPREIKQNQELIFKPQCLAVKYIIMVIGYLIVLASIIAMSVNSRKESPFNQYCMIASFYVGLFGSFFMSNIIKIWIQSLFVSHYEGSNVKWLMRTVLSSNAVRILKEIQYAREADRELIVNQEVGSPEEKLVGEIKSQNRLSIYQPEQQCNIEDIVFFDKKGSAEKGTFSKTQPQKSHPQKSHTKGQFLSSLESHPDLKSEKELFGSAEKPSSQEKGSKLFNILGQPGMIGDENEDIIVDEQIRNRSSVLVQLRKSLERSEKKVKQAKYMCVTENDKTKEKEINELEEEQ